MPRHPHSNSQHNTPPSEPGNSTTTVHEKCNIAEVQDENFKIVIMNIFKDIKDINKALKEI